MYKCTDANDQVKFQDRPCETGADAQSFSENGSPNSEYSAALQRLAEEQIELRMYPKTDEVRELIEPIVKASALKIYTRVLVFEDMLKYCSPVLAPSNIDLAATLQDYKEVQNDNITVGKKVFYSGFEYPEQNVSFTHEELVSKLEEGKSRNSMKFIEADGVAAKDVEIACIRQHELMQGAVKYGI